MKIFDRVVNVPSSCIRATRVADVLSSGSLMIGRPGPTTGIKSEVAEFLAVRSNWPAQWQQDKHAGDKKQQDSRHASALRLEHPGGESQDKGPSEDCRFSGKFVETECLRFETGRR
nr:hypothetical protein [Methylocystis hirsuta]